MLGSFRFVEAELKLVQIERQIRFAYFVIRSYDSALEQAPKAFDGIGMDHAAHVFARTVANDLMRQGIRPFTEQTVTAVFIRGDKIDFLFIHRAAHELIKRLGIGVLESSCRPRCPYAR